MDKITLLFKENYEKDGLTLQRQKKKKCGMHHVKLYDEGVQAVQELTGVEYSLFFWLAMRSQDNIAYNNKHVRNDFNDFSSGRYSPSTIARAFSELKRKDFLIDRFRGVLWLNPLYVWKGSEEERVGAIKTIFDSRYTNLKVTVEK